MTLLLLAVCTVTATPAAVAHSGECAIVEQVYGVDQTGDLIVQPFCIKPGESYLPARTLASFGANVPQQLFYGGQLPDLTVIIYGVGADGTLRWYRENGSTGQLDPGVAVGSQFGDWRNYQYLQSAGGGDLSGIDAAGRLWRWVHLGWQDGTDQWAEGEPLEVGCPGTRPVFTGRNGPQRFVGVAVVGPSYLYCGHDGQAHLASVLPAGVDAMTMAVGPGVSYALRRSDSRLTRLTLDVEAKPPVWRTGAVGRPGFVAIFTGRSIVTDQTSPIYRYEWQWTWYEDCT
ncbi:hypothetical protein Rhe02_02230 [Rhizocola hellebori]|uniref:Uncharacterized protein n=1 Tax=Rhizocola hellebori TaxID=1392758 RepID=A0A8J3VD45_9ACTN|nr:hypothetical protein Rhe02_02230 [Rhizocola hellebori]